MQAVSLGCLFVDDFLQFCQIAGTCADKFFCQGNLQHNILVADAGSPGERRFLLNSVKMPMINTSSSAARLRLMPLLLQRAAYMS